MDQWVAFDGLVWVVLAMRFVTADKLSKVELSKPMTLPTSPCRGAAPVGYDVGRHGCAALSITLVYVLDDALSFFAAGEIEVDIRPFAALFA